MAILDSLKSKKLPIGVFAGLKKAPGPARIFITLNYSDKLSFCSGYRGFTVKSFNQNNKPTGTIAFEIPVTPPTIQLDFGNSKDSENVARIGEVVLPKYEKATQIRWSSFFPYDTSAPYLNTTTRNLSWSSLSNLANRAKSLYQNTVSDITGLTKTEPTPDIYIKLFKILSSSEEPFTVSMTFYDGGNMPAKKYTLDSFRANPENNGDYTYDLSLVEWTDISPKLINNKGVAVDKSNIKVKDKIKFKNIKNIKDFWNFCKQCYPTVSKKLMWAFSTYNGVRNLVFDAILKGWKIKGSLQDLGGRFGIVNNILGVSKITSKDTAAVSNSLKKLSFTKASKQMADLLKQNMTN